ncbi:hypothetical protein [Candidatus Blastococcus massiliensis]|uniref:hypothetical protein n=1 Tax=Candidatus Blastococcus massiliensis TaxID=1470358 RepID=UPI0004B4C60D|nr:hypothetical protein [Candidatus Blastococcus massiliensis]
MTAPDYSLVVPADWSRLDLTAADGGAAQVRRMVRRLAGRADLQAQLRRELVEHVDAACADAKQRGGVDLYLSTGGPAGTLVAASLLVTVSPQHVGAEHAVPELAVALTDGGEATVVEIGGCRAVRRVREDLPGDLPTDGRRSLVVQYAFVVPEVVVMLSFSTPVLALAEPLTVLFDAVAETFRWRGEAA